MVWPELMLDLEYLAGRTDAGVVQIGAMPFRLETGESGPAFSANLDVESQIRDGRRLDARALHWWMGQAVEKGMPPWWSNTVDAKTGVQNLGKFIEENCDPRNVKVWCHINCDAVKIGDICSQYGMQMPWLWKNTRHIHTLVLLSGVKPPKHSSTDHEAVNDCIRQIKYCHQCWLALHPRYVDLTGKVQASARVSS